MTGSIIELRAKIEALEELDRALSDLSGGHGHVSTAYMHESIGTRLERHRRDLRLAERLPCPIPRHLHSDLETIDRGQ